MKYYELTFLISPELSEENLKSLQEKIHSFIQEEGGILDEVKKPIKKKLGYPIKKKSLAYFSYIVFQILPEKLANLEKKLRSQSEIIRYMICTKKEEKAILPVSAKEKRPSLKPKPKVELEEIEKKLEEILGEQ